LFFIFQKQFGTITDVFGVGQNDCNLYLKTKLVLYSCIAVNP